MSSTKTTIKLNKKSTTKCTTKRINRSGHSSLTNLPTASKKTVESEESDSTDVATSSDEEDRWKETKRAAEDLPPEYWNIQKLVKYIKAGNPTATMVALCCLKDYDLTTPINQAVIGIFFLELNIYVHNSQTCIMHYYVICIIHTQALSLYRG